MEDAVENSIAVALGGIPENLQRNYQCVLIKLGVDHAVKYLRRRIL